MALRRPTAAALALLAGLLAADLALSALVLRDGRFGDRPLPPFGAITHPRQRAWLERQRTELAELEAGAPAGAPSSFDPELGWEPRPSSTSDGLGFGALGARGPREYAPDPPPGVVRLSCYGDSFTECGHVGEAQTWQHHLEQLLPQVEALNFGVGGYGTDQALLRFRRREARAGSRGVLIGLMLENCGRNVNRYRPLWYPSAGSCVAKPRFALEGGGLELVPLPFGSRAELVAAVLDGSVLERLAPREHWSRHELGPLRHSSFARLAAGWRAYRARDVRSLWLEPQGEPYRVTLALLLRFHAEAQAGGARIAPVLVFPREDDLGELVRTGEPYWQGLLDDLERAGVPAIDLARPLAAAVARGDAPHARALYRAGHLTAQGNAIVAEALAERLGPRLGELGRR